MIEQYKKTRKAVVVMKQEVNDTKNELMARGVIVDDNGKILGFNANYFAEYIRTNYPIIYGMDNCFYMYKNGAWIKVNDDSIFKMLRDILQEPKFGVWRKRFEEEYIVALKREIYHAKEMNMYNHIINLKNGVFDIRDMIFSSHNPKHFSTIQIPVEYKENAECPTFLKYLDEVFEGDKERIAVAQEWFGYALTTETKAQKALILYGSGGNGKGVFVEVLSLLIGADNISHIPLNELHKGFSRVCLYGKTANISSENESDGKTLNTQYFKAIVGEDVINAEQKGKPVFSFKPTVKMIFSMNNFPTTKDKSNGYYRRLMILNFSAYFSEENRDKDLKKKLRKELPGIFLWAIEGLKRLKENDYKFSKCRNMEEMLDEYKVEQNPLIGFFDECVAKEDDTEHRESNKEIYEAFKKWAEDNGHKVYASISSQKFWKQFEALAKERGWQCKSGRSNSFRYHTGVRVEYKAYSENKNKWSNIEGYNENCADMDDMGED